MAPAIMPNHDSQVMLINFTSYSHFIHNPIIMSTAIPHHMHMQNPPTKPACKTKLDASNRFMQKLVFRGF